MMNDLMNVSIKSVKHETPKAWLTILEDNQEIWFPKSQCKIDGTTISAPRWLVKEKGLLDQYDE
jgi:hypothetical protein